MNAVEIKSLDKVIKKTKILNSIDLELRENQIYGFYGRNGSGKTMLFRAICGLIIPTNGEIKIFEEVLHQEISFPRSVGVIIEYPGFINQMTGYKNLELLASIKGLIDSDQLHHIIEAVGLDPSDKRKVKQYSLGMKQRLGIAQAIMESPDLIILDEPTNSLDESGVAMLKDILIHEKKRGATILIASHNKADLDELCDSQFKIDHGCLTEER